MNSFYSQLKKFAVPSVFILATLLITWPRSAAAAPSYQTEQVPTDPPAAGPIISAESIELGRGDLQAAYLGCGGPAPAITDAAFEQRVVEVTNDERANVGLPPLKLNDSLSDAARHHSVDMAQDDYFEHDTYDRSDDSLVHVCIWYERVRSFVPDGAAIGENLAWGYDSPEAAVNGWMESEGHRENMLRDSYSEIGVGYYDLRWSQEFARRENVYPVIINREAGATDSADTTIYAYGDWQRMRLRNDSDAWSEWRAFSNQIDWRINAIPGKRTVDIELTDGSRSVVSSDSIEYTGPAQQEPIITEFSERVYLPLVIFR